MWMAGHYTRKTCWPSKVSLTVSQNLDYRTRRPPISMILDFPLMYFDNASEIHMGHTL